jgi:hypothetical protein
MLFCLGLVLLQQCDHRRCAARPDSNCRIAVPHARAAPTSACRKATSAPPRIAQPGEKGGQTCAADRPIDECFPPRILCLTKCRRFMLIRVGWASWLLLYQNRRAAAPDGERRRHRDAMGCDPGAALSDLRPSHRSGNRVVLRTSCR